MQRERRVKNDTHVSDTWKCGSSSFISTHPPEDLKKKKKNGDLHRAHSQLKCIVSTSAAPIKNQHQFQHQHQHTAAATYRGPINDGARVYPLRELYTEVFGAQDEGLVVRARGGQHDLTASRKSIRSDVKPVSEAAGERFIRSVSDTFGKRSGR